MKVKKGAGKKIVRDMYFFNDTATTEIYTLSLHDALPIFSYHEHNERARSAELVARMAEGAVVALVSDAGMPLVRDRKSTRLNSSHANISYAVFCLKKKNLSSPPLTLMYTRPSNLPNTVLS